MTRTLEALAAAHAMRLGRPYTPPPDARLVAVQGDAQVWRREPEPFSARHCDSPPGAAGSAWAREIGDE